MKRKDRDYDGHHESKDKITKLNSYEEELASRTMEDERIRLKEVSKLYVSLPNDNLKKEKAAMRKRFTKAVGGFCMAKHRIRLVSGTKPGAGSSDAGKSGQEARDLKKGTVGNQSSGSSDVRTEMEGKVKNLVFPGSDSVENEEPKKQRDTGDASTDEEGFEQSNMERFLKSLPSIL